MVTTLPGTIIEVSALTPGVSRTLFDGIFAGGGITLSQVSVMTGLEPHVIQNWVKRGFVSSPCRRQYSKNQFSRIVIIHMLRESLQLEHICHMLRYINGSLEDESDDLIEDSELYHIYTDMIAQSGEGVGGQDAIRRRAEDAATKCTESTPEGRKRLAKILEIMAYAHYAAETHKAAEQALSQLY